jgi:hypothetical protein
LASQYGRRTKIYGIEAKLPGEYYGLKWTWLTHWLTKWLPDSFRHSFNLGEILQDAILENSLEFC